MVAYNDTVTGDGAAVIGDVSLAYKIVGIASEPRTEGQARYMETLEKHDIVFGIGPAGTGKTYLAVARALMSLRHGDINHHPHDEKENVPINHQHGIFKCQQLQIRVEVPPDIGHQKNRYSAQKRRGSFVQQVKGDG